VKQQVRGSEWSFGHHRIGAISAAAPVLLHTEHAHHMISLSLTKAQ
jgi:hypothetical protein